MEVCTLFKGPDTGVFADILVNVGDGFVSCAACRDAACRGVNAAGNRCAFVEGSAEGVIFFLFHLNYTVNAVGRTGSKTVLRNIDPEGFGVVIDESYRGGPEALF